MTQAEIDRYRELANEPEQHVWRLSTGVCRRCGAFEYGLEPCRPKATVIIDRVGLVALLDLATKALGK